MEIIPSTFFIDFETAMLKAIESVYPESEVRGCNFHLGQSWYKKIKQLDLSQSYIDQVDNVGKWLTYIFGLPFLHPEEVSECFVEDYMATKPDDPSMDLFCDYIVDTYVSEQSIFPPKIWARNVADIYRTTNACEAFHSDLNSNFYFAHPQIFAFVEVLKTVQLNTYIKIRSATLVVKRRENKAANLKKKYISAKIVEYEEGLITRWDFVKAVGYRNKFYKSAT